MHCVTQGIGGCALILVGDPTWAVGKCMDVAKAQACVPLISTMHGQPFLIPVITRNIALFRKGQYKTCIEADIPCINLTINWYIMHSPQPLSTAKLTSQPKSSPWCFTNEYQSNAKCLRSSASEWVRNRFEVCVSALAHSPISSCIRAAPWIFDWHCWNQG